MKRWQFEVAILHYSWIWLFCHLANPEISFVLRIYSLYNREKLCIFSLTIKAT